MERLREVKDRFKRLLRRKSRQSLSPTASPSANGHVSTSPRVSITSESQGPLLVPAGPSLSITLPVESPPPVLRPASPPPQSIVSEPIPPQPSLLEPQIPIQQSIAPKSPSEVVIPPTIRSELWEEALKQVNSKTKKWMMNIKSPHTNALNLKEQIDEIIHLVEKNKLSEQSNDKPWKMKIGEQTIIFREYVNDVVRFFTMIGDVAVTFAPPQIGAPWAAAKAILMIPVKEVEQMAALLGTAKLFVRIARRGQLYERLYQEITDEAAVKNFRESLLELYVAATELLAESETLFKAGLAKQTLMSILQPDKATGLISGIFKKEQKLALEVQSCEAINQRQLSGDLKKELTVIQSQLDQLSSLSSPITRVDDNVAKLLEVVSEAERERLLDFISTEKFGRSHATIMESRTENTSEWLLRNADFRNWLDIPQSSTLLWLKGAVGTGKTYLTCRVIHHIENTLQNQPHHEGFAFFYCSRSGHSLQDPQVVLQSFVRQLSSIAHDTEKVQVKLMEKWRTAKDKGTDLSYKDCKELILDSVALFSKTTLILDALDETDATTHNLAETLIEIMQKSSKPIKIFISSRPECYKVFEGWSTISIDAAEQSTDIETFLEENLYSHRDKFFQRRSQTTQALIKDTFSKRHGGMFRWAYLQVEALKRCKTDGAIINWAKKLPSGLMETYDQIWEGINELDREDSALAKRAIMWVMCAMAKMPVDGLLEAIRYVPNASTVSLIEAQSKEVVLSLCKNLLEIDVEKNEWVFPHASVPEYFESKLWPLEICDAFVSRASLGFLMNTQLRQDLQDISKEDLKDFWYYTGKMKTNIHGRRFFCAYALNIWPLHVERYDRWLGSNNEAHAEEAAELTATLKGFLGSPEQSSTQYQEWIHILTHVASADDMPSTMRRCVIYGYTGPSSTPLLTICRFGFFYVLHDWWLETRTIKQLALEEYRSRNGPVTALESAFIGNCMAIYITYFSNSYSTRQENAIDIVLNKRDHDLFEWIVGTIGVDAPIRRDWERYNWDHENLYQHASLLILCAKACEVWAVEVVLKAGADVNFVAEWGCYGSALAAAAGEPPWGGQTRVIQTLLDHGADVNLPLKIGEYGSAFEAALSWDDEELPNFLLAAGADPTMISSVGPYGSALACAVFYGHLNIVKAMVKKVGKERTVDALRQSKPHPPPHPPPHRPEDPWKNPWEDPEEDPEEYSVIDHAEIISNFGFGDYIHKEPESG
ncbi:hypothetical protein PT974_02412 [Cladobotryum mycophilum]|uniref:Nephrocystin 3-like N-terminal domain-containing protein n=1 Tax=Cladobotryum mycophilum TaxID=491253 RepID=A0ABR0SY07_9HYPO